MASTYQVHVASSSLCHVLGSMLTRRGGVFTQIALFGDISVFAKIHYNPIVVGDAVNNEGSKKYDFKSV